MALGWLLFGKGARHLTAEMLYEEATLAKVPVSLATVYNTLNQLTDAGLLRQVSVDGTKTYFDTNVTAHHHFYLENNHELVDIPRPASGAAEDAGRAGRLRDQPGRYGGAAAQEALSSIDIVRAKRMDPCHNCRCCGRRLASGCREPRIHGSRALALAGMTRERSVHLLVGIDAPQPLLLDPAVETVCR